MTISFLMRDRRGIDSGGRRGEDMGVKGEKITIRIQSLKNPFSIKKKKTERNDNTLSPRESNKAMGNHEFSAH